jgi:hypothetical protein
MRIVLTSANREVLMDWYGHNADLCIGVSGQLLVNLKDFYASTAFIGEIITPLGSDIFWWRFRYIFNPAKCRLSFFSCTLLCIHETGELLDRFCMRFDTGEFYGNISSHNQFLFR